MAAKSNVLLIGGGAVGTMTAYALESGGLANVTMVLRSNYVHVRESGYTINSIDHGADITSWRPSSVRNTIPDLQQEQLPPYDYIVLTTKNTPDIGSSLVSVIAPAVAPTTTAIVLVQNGLNIEKPFHAQYPTNPILSGVQLIGAEEKSPGVILHNEPDVCKLGPFPFPSAPADTDRTARDESSAQQFVRIYAACGRVQCQYDENVRYTRWRKLLYNASYNSVSAVLGFDVTRMRLYEHVIDDLIKPIMYEIIAVAAADGFVLDESLVMQMITIDSLSSWFMPSMGQDAAKGNFIEFENIVGEPVREAERLGVPCPTLTVMYSILKGVQARIKEKRGVLQPAIEKAGKYR